jgi:ABC-2 type transport system permease protein
MMINNASIADGTVASAGASPRTASRFGVYYQETRYELIKLVREPLYPAAVMGFPILFFLLFGLGNGHVQFHGHLFPRYLIASYSCFGAIGGSLLAVGTGVAVERGFGWLELKRASPMPPSAYLAAKVTAGVLAAIVGTLALLAVAALTTPLDVSLAEAAHLLVANIACALVFASLGLALGLLLAPASAPGMMYMIYLPLSLCAGLWLPLETLPRWIQSIAVFLPSYYSAQLSHASLGYDTALTEPALWAANFGFAVLFAVAALLIYKHQESTR